MSIFEVIMLICFGASWPISIIKTIKAKNPVGKSIIFLYLVLIGYIAGCLNKYYNSPGDDTIWLYALNGAMVSVDIILAHYYINLRKKKEI
jgi:hypothetical protein